MLLLAGKIAATTSVEALAALADRHGLQLADSTGGVQDLDSVEKLLALPASDRQPLLGTKMGMTNDE